MLRREVNWEDFSLLPARKHSWHTFDFSSRAGLPRRLIRRTFFSTTFLCFPTSTARSRIAASLPPFFILDKNNRFNSFGLMVRTKDGGWSSSCVLLFLLVALLSISSVRARSYGASRQGLSANKRNEHRLKARKLLKRLEGRRVDGCGSGFEQEEVSRPLEEQIVATRAAVLALSTSTEGRGGGFNIVSLVNSVTSTTASYVIVASLSPSTTRSAEQTPTFAPFSNPPQTTLSGFATSRSVHRHHHLVESPSSSVSNSITTSASPSPTSAPVSDSSIVPSSTPSSAGIISPGSISTTILSTTTQIVKAGLSSARTGQHSGASTGVNFFDETQGEMDNNGLERGDQIIVTELARTTSDELVNGNTVIVM